MIKIKTNSPKRIKLKDNQKNIKTEPIKKKSAQLTLIFDFNSNIYQGEIHKE